MTALTYNDVLSAYSEYPAPIRPFLLRAETHPKVRDCMTKRGLRVFIDLLARAPISDPTRPILVRVDETAARIGIGYKTVSRVIAWMLEAGWLSFFPRHDGRDNDGKFGHRQFVVGYELREMVGLPLSDIAPPRPKDHQLQDEPASGETVGTPLPPSGQSAALPCPAEQTEMSDGSAPTLPESGSLERITSANPLNQAKTLPCMTKMSDGHIGVNKFFLKEASAKEASNEKPSSLEFRIPAGLTELHTLLGISPRGIGALLNQAKRAKQRLQDVWIVGRERILNAGATEGRAKIYLESMIRSGDDFSYTARVKATTPSVEPLSKKALRASDGTVNGADGPSERVGEEEGSREAAAPGEPTTRRASGNQFHGRRFAGPRGSLLMVNIDGTGNFSDNTVSGIFVSPRDMGPMFSAIERGIFVEQHT